MGNWLVLNGMVDFKCKMCAGCCKGWNIYISKDEYIKLQEIIDEGLLKEATEILPESINESGYARFTNISKDCCFLEENNLCMIHKKYGFGYLPHICTVFPRRIFITPRGIEVSVIFSCPEVTKLLLSKEKIKVVKNPPGFFFDVSHLSLPTITEELLNSKDETKWYFRLEEAFIDILQDGVFTLEKRMAIVGLLIYYFNKYSCDEDRQKEYPELLKKYRSLSRQAGCIEPRLDYQLQVLKRFIDFKMQLKASDEWRQTVIKIYRQMNLIPDSLVSGENINSYDVNLRFLYNEREWGYISANYLVCNLFSKLLYIFGLEGGFFALSFLYSMIRFMAVGMAALKGSPVNEEILMKAISIVDYNVRHTSDFMDHILLSQGFQKYETGCFSVAHSLMLISKGGK